MSAHWETVASSGVQKIWPLILNLVWLECYIFCCTFNLPVSICLNFYLAFRLTGIKKTKVVCFLLFLKLFRLVLFLQDSGSKMLFFFYGIMIYSSFLIILLYIYVFLNLSNYRYFVSFLSTVADGEWSDDVILYDATNCFNSCFRLASLEN